MGAAPCPSAQQLAGVVDASDPCQQLNQCDLNTGIDPVTGRICSQLVVPMPLSAAVPAPAPGSGFCLTPLFPWLGQSFAGVCAPVVSIPAPWNTILTVGVIGLIVMKLGRGR
jgi:hypothetical protein